MQRIVDGPQPFLRDVQQPVGHRLPGQFQSLTIKFLFQTVQRRVHDKLLRCQISHCLRGGKTAGQQCGLFWSLHNVGLASLLLTVLAGVGVVYVLTDPELCRLHLQRPAYFFADLNQLAAASRADPLILRKTVLYYLGGRTLWNDIQHIAGLSLALMRFHSDLLLSGGFDPESIGFQLIHSQAQLIHDHLL